MEKEFVSEPEFVKEVESTKKPKTKNDVGNMYDDVFQQREHTVESRHENAVHNSQVMQQLMAIRQLNQEQADYLKRMQSHLSCIFWVICGPVILAGILLAISILTGSGILASILGSR